MYSVNAAVPGRVSALAADLRPALSAFASIRREHSILIKRLGDTATFQRQSKRIRRELAGTQPIDVTVTGIEYFADPPRGPGPVVYLALDSPGLDRLHGRLVEAFGAETDLEGEAYTMHITLARDGPLEAAERLSDRSIESVSWTITELLLWDAAQARAVGTIPLPIPP